MKITFTILLSIFWLCSYAQISMGGKPYSFEKELKTKSIKKNKSSQIVLTELDFKKLKQEDKIIDSLGKPYRYGTAINVVFDLNNSGEWILLENGDRIWKLPIRCPKAKSINISYDKFWIPIGAQFYLYSKDKSSHIGGYNSKNNKGDKSNPLGFATGLIFNEEIVLEYYEPKEVRGEGVISLSKIIYGYKDIRENEVAFGDGPSCSVNVNCSPEGDNWQDEKTSVAKILMNGFICTGSLIANTRRDNTPYFLTADHCIETNNLDAISDPDASDFIFWWNYESNDCSNGTGFEPPSTVGATVIANDDPTDFALLRLLESPYDLTPQIQTYFNGWDLQTNSNNAVSIHHPAGDIKKISTENDPPTLNSNRWAVYWDNTQNGNSATRGGSSGSPLYNSNSRVIGQAWTANTSACVNQYTSYGRFDMSWDDGAEARRRLKDWLDPDNTNLNFLNGGYFCEEVEIISRTISSDETINGCNVKVENVTIQNNADIEINIEHGIIIQKKFEVRQASTLLIE